MRGDGECPSGHSGRVDVHPFRCVLQYARRLGGVHARSANGGDSDSERRRERLRASKCMATRHTVVPHSGLLYRKGARPSTASITRPRSGRCRQYTNPCQDRHVGARGLSGSYHVSGQMHLLRRVTGRGQRYGLWGRQWYQPYHRLFEDYRASVSWGYTRECKGSRRWGPSSPSSFVSMGRGAEGHLSWQGACHFADHLNSPYRRRPERGASIESGPSVRSSKCLNAASPFSDACAGDLSPYSFFACVTTVLRYKRGGFFVPRECVVFIGPVCGAKWGRRGPCYAQGKGDKTSSAPLLSRGEGRCHSLPQLQEATTLYARPSQPLPIQ